MARCNPRPSLIVTALILVTWLNSLQCPSADGQSDEPRPDLARCQEWAQAFGRAVRAGDMEAANQSIDWDNLRERGMAWPNPSPELQQRRTVLIEHFKSKKTLMNPIPAQLRERIRQGASFHLLRVRAADGNWRAEFRSDRSKKTPHYYAFLLAAGEDGSVRAVDRYDYGLGVWESSFFRLGLLGLIAMSPETGAHLSPTDRDRVAHEEEFEQMSDLAEKNDNQGFFKLYDQLPDSMKKDRMVLNLRLAATQKVGRKEFTRALSEYRQLYPKDIAADLFALDDLLDSHAHSEALAAIDHIDKRVGGDPYLNVLRAQISADQGKTDAARKLAEKAMEQEPTLEFGHIFLINQALSAKDFARTAKLLSAWEAKCGIKLDDLTTLPEFQDFVKSHDYEEWLKRKKEPEATQPAAR
jgi:hypothetical protein